MACLWIWYLFALRETSLLAAFRIAPVNCFPADRMSVSSIFIPITAQQESNNKAVTQHALIVPYGLGSCFTVRPLNFFSAANMGSGLRFKMFNVFCWLYQGQNTAHFRANKPPTPEGGISVTLRTRICRTKRMTEKLKCIAQGKWCIWSEG